MIGGTSSAIGEVEISCTEGGREGSVSSGRGGEVLGEGGTEPDVTVAVRL